jgi:hypothetical protein
MLAFVGHQLAVCARNGRPLLMPDGGTSYAITEITTNRSA